jgi:chorismate synthase
LNTIGTIVRLTIFGSSHGPAVGAVLDGLPSGVGVDMARIEEELALRRPRPPLGTPRVEEDRVDVVSGVLDGESTGNAITLMVRNRDVDSSKYEQFRRLPRPGHADLVALGKYGEHHDLRGGGQFSGRLTVAIVAAGTIARTWLEESDILIAGHSANIGGVEDVAMGFAGIRSSRGSAVRAIDKGAERAMVDAILAARREGDSVGGIVRCMVEGLPLGVGEPFFDTLDGELAKMMFAIPGVKGVEFGSGFGCARMRGSEHNDPFVIRGGEVVTEKNDAGGVLGGISNGMPLEFRVAFKPTASIGMRQMTVDLEEMREAELIIEGRHDPCIVPRAVAVVEAATALVLSDLCRQGGLIG